MEFNQEPLLNIGITTESEIDFSLNGSFLFANKKLKEGKYTAKIKDGKIVCSAINEIRNEIIFDPLNDSSYFTINMLVGSGFHWERSKTLSFEGSLKLMIDDNHIVAINIIPTEKYLLSVISSEMSAESNLEFLKAHTIVSRSWLLAQLLNKEKTHSPQEIINSDRSTFIKWYDKNDHQLFDLCADDHCQRYHGITRVISERASQAIDQTRGQVLLYDKEICDARFSKCCGGISERFENVWDNTQHRYLTPINDNDVDNNSQFPSSEEEAQQFIDHSKDDFCNTSDGQILSQVLVDFDRETNDFYRWQVVYTQKEIAQLIKENSKIDFGDIIDLIPIERGTSTRIIQLKIIGTRKTITIGKELEIRRWLSSSHLYSSAFYVTKKYHHKDKLPTSFTLHGAGWGHGVGFCQIGAAVMSCKGYSSKQILNHYFTDTEVMRIY